MNLDSVKTYANLVTCIMLVFVTILLYHTIGYNELIRYSVLVTKHTSIRIPCITPKINATTLLKLQLVETVKKHDLSIRQESARHYTTFHIAKTIFYIFIDLYHRWIFVVREIYRVYTIQTPIKTSTGFAIHYLYSILQEFLPNLDFLCQHWAFCW